MSSLENNPHIEGSTGRWEYVIGLEVHAQISSKSKLFSSSATKFGANPNTQVSLIDVAYPGMLPVLNEYCVHQAIKTGLAINARINKYSVFDRKNYFYADLPQGYQISQFYLPIVEDGYLNLSLKDGTQKKIRINRMHLEQDAGKSMHDQSPDYSLIDLNRAGVALMEIVTEPDLRSPYEASEYIKKLRNVLRYIGTCDCNMEQGSLRCDANVSVRKKGDSLGTRCEIKNLNSVKSIIKAIEVEAMRQVEILENGGIIRQETMLFDVNTNSTRAMRDKENANDYRYFPDPDLKPIKVSDNLIDTIKSDMQELPDSKVERYINDLGLSKYDAEVIVENKETAEYFETACNDGTHAKQIANWIIGDLFGMLNKNDQDLSKCKVKPAMISELVNVIENGTISGKIAKTVFEKMFINGKNPKVIIEEEGLVQMSDASKIEKIIDEVLTANSDSVAKYKSGKTKLLGFFVGQVMKQTQGKANPQIVNKILNEKLGT